MRREPLPIDQALPRLLAALRERGAVVLRAPTGAGKTTRVPPAIAESGLAETGTIIMLEPRRVAARRAARRMAAEHGSPLGDVFGCGAGGQGTVVTDLAGARVPPSHTQVWHSAFGGFSGVFAVGRGQNAKVGALKLAF